MRRDTIFYQIFQRYPSLFFDLINQHSDEAKRYEFTPEPFPPLEDIVELVTAIAVYKIESLPEKR